MKNIEHTDLIQLMKFMEMTNKFNLVKRLVPKKDDTLESDPEHCFQLALVSWYLIQKHELALDLEKVFKYALAHDLVEVYAGDVDAFTQTEEVAQKKKQAEHKAYERLKKEFPEFPEIFQIIQEYEKKIDQESRFVYSLDKILPVINIELNNGDYYLKNQSTREIYMRFKDKKIQQHDLNYEYFQLLTTYLDQKGDFFYPDCKNRDYTNKEYQFK